MHGEHHPPLTAVQGGLLVRRGEQRHQLHGLDERTPRPCHIEPPPAPLGRVGRDQFVLDGEREHLRQAGECLVDDPRAEHALGRFRGLVAVDLSNRDLREVILEEREQVVAECPPVILDRPDAEALLPTRRDPLARELVKRRLGGGSSWTGSGSEGAMCRGARR